MSRGECLITATVEVGRECSGILVGDFRVSRRHIALTANVDGLTLTDLGSSNGTTVNGTRVTSPVVVRTGDVIRLGGTEIGVVERTAAPPRPASAPPERLTLMDTPPAPAAPAAPADPQPEPVAFAPPTVVAPIPQLPVAAPAPAIDPAALAPAAGSDGRVTLLVSAPMSTDEALRRAHREIVEYWLPRHSGRMVATVDGALVCGFASPRGALLCAIALARGIAAFNRGREGGGVQVRTAVHAGDATAEETGLALTVAAAAAPGEVLVSSAVREAAGDGDEFSFAEPRTVPVAGHEPVRVLPLRAL